MLEFLCSCCRIDVFEIIYIEIRVVGIFDVFFEVNIFIELFVVDYVYDIYFLIGVVFYSRYCLLELYVRYGCNYVFIMFGYWVWIFVFWVKVN